MVIQSKHLLIKPMLIQSKHILLKPMVIQSKNILLKPMLILLSRKWYNQLYVMLGLGPGVRVRV